MIHFKWHGLPLLVALGLAGCGGGDAPSGDTKAAKVAPIGAQPVVMEPVPPEPPETPPGAAVPRLTVEDRSFVVQYQPGYHRLMEDPDGSGPLPERPITAVTNSPTLDLPAGTDLAHVLGAQYRVAACTPTVRLVRQGWLLLPKTFWNCNGASATVRLDATAIARTFAVAPTLTEARIFSVSPAGTRAAFAIRIGACADNIVVIDTSAERDRVASLSLGTTGDCRTTRLSLALAASGGALAIGLPDAPDALGRPAGAVQVYTQPGDGAWAPAARLNAPQPGPGQAFGTSVAFSADGQRLLVGAPGAGAPSAQGASVPAAPPPGQAVLFEAPFGRPAWTPAAVFSGQAFSRLGTLVAMNPAGTSVTLVSPVIPDPFYTLCTQHPPTPYPLCLVQFGYSQTLALAEDGWRPAVPFTAEQVSDDDFRAALGHVTAERPFAYPPLPTDGDTAAWLAYQRYLQSMSAQQRP